MKKDDTPQSTVVCRDSLSFVAWLAADSKNEYNGDIKSIRLFLAEAVRRAIVFDMSHQKAQAPLFE